MSKKARRRSPHKRQREGDGAEQQQAFAALLYGHRLTHLSIVRKPGNPDAREVYGEELDTFDVDLTFDNGLVCRVRSYRLPEMIISWRVNISGSRKNNEPQSDALQTITFLLSCSHPQYSLESAFFSLFFYYPF